MTVEPLSRAFNVAVLQIASRLFPCGFDISADAPDTLANLTRHVKRTGRMIVSSLHSDRTIFADREVNYAFRAWHDWHHWRRQLPFTPEGERETCRAQAADLATIYGRRTARPFLDILTAEVIGQDTYRQRTGSFPVDQMRFTRAWLADPTHALAQEF